jgi:hypothetical protein
VRWILPLHPQQEQGYGAERKPLSLALGLDCALFPSPWWKKSTRRRRCVDEPFRSPPCSLL